ncbi:MAG: hypothetical protein P8100_06655 [bacterium]
MSISKALLYVHDLTHIHFGFRTLCGTQGGFEEHVHLAFLALGAEAEILVIE